MVSYLQYICFVGLLTRFCATVNVMEFEDATAILKKILVGYKKQIIPNKDGKPVEITLQMYIGDMVPLKSLHMHYSLDFYLREEWYDDRLAYNKSDKETALLLPGEMMKEIWVPDLYFPNVKEPMRHPLTTTNAIVHIYGDGRVFTSQRLAVTSFCAMTLLFFPFDFQTYEFRISSYGYQSKFMKLKWRSKNAVTKSNPKAHLHMKDFQDVEFSIENLTEFYEDLGNTEGSFSVLRIKFKFYRNIGAHVFRDYVPCLLTVVLSWVSFWIDYRSTPSRVALGVTTVLTMVTLSTGMNWRLPSVSIFRSIDLYFLVCNVYVFGVVVEFAVVCMKDPKIGGRKIARRGTILKDDKHKQEALEMLRILANQNASSEGEGLDDDEAETDLCHFKRRHIKQRNDENSNGLNNSRTASPDKDNAFFNLASVVVKDMKKRFPKTHHIDEYCKIIFPSTFIFLNSCYFIFHLVKYTNDSKHIHK